MTRPRQVLPSRSYLLSRRCSQRQHLLRPGGYVDRIYLYCLGEAVARYEMTLHGYVAMSNHQHVLVRDNRGELPKFFAHLNKMVAKALNRHWGRWENFWSSGQPSVVRLVDAQDRFDKLIYLLANPVTGHLVERAEEWPGASSLEQTFSGEAHCIARPDGYFRDNGPMPAEVSITIERPAGFEHLSASEWSAMIRVALRVQEERAREERAAKGLVVLGRDGVLAAAHTDRPRGVEPRRRLSPEVACRDPEQRASELAALSGFRAAHVGALCRLRAGERDIVFPEGSYRMRMLGLRSEAADENAPAVLEASVRAKTNQGQERAAARPETNQGQERAAARPETNQGQEPGAWSKTNQGQEPAVRSKTNQGQERAPGIRRARNEPGSGKRTKVRGDGCSRGAVRSA